MKAPCLKDIEETFKIECYNADYEYFHKWGCEPELYMFPQVWSSTALGFGGIGGSTMTQAYTTICQDLQSGYCGVFFGERLAYLIHNPTQQFFEDWKAQYMRPINEKGIYIRKEN